MVVVVVCVSTKMVVVMCVAAKSYLSGKILLTDRSVNKIFPESYDIAAMMCGVHEMWAVVCGV
jgi:hypothetical protein